MLRFTPIDNARQAEHYYSKSDGGYYLQADDLHREWGGQGAAMLGLLGAPDYEQFKRLIHGLDPRTGEQLTAKLIEDRVPGWDVTASVPKGVTTALERGDERIRDVIWAASRKAMAELEELATTRVRKGGKHEDRLTQNLVWFATEHPETRPTKEDGMPDWDRHIHFVVFNETFDPVEQEWKAVKFRPIMDLRKWFSTRFDMYVSRGLTDLGYEIETKYRSDGSGGRKYYSWDINGIPDAVLKNFSRRSAEVEATEKEILQAMKEEDGYAPDSLSAVARDKLGATSRLHKRGDLTLADYREYWNSRVTPEEGREIAETIRRAREGLNPKPANMVDKAVERAIRHVFERNSVVDWRDLAIAAMERSMGVGLPDDILPEAHRKGVLLKDGEATTREILAEESSIIDFAREGRGTMRPLGRDQGAGLSLAAVALHEAARKHSDNVLLTLPNGQSVEVSREQYGVARHVWESPDQVILIRGAAGTGKTHTMKATIAGIDQPVAVLAPTVDASRGVLRRDGFQDADTVAAFLRDAEWQASLKGGVIYVDEAGMLPIKDLAQLVDVARKQDARIILQGDPRQHKSVARHGNMFEALQTFAGLPVAELRTIRRQENDRHREAVAAIESGDIGKGHDILRDQGWIQQVDTSDVEKRIASQCWDFMHRGEDFIVVGITHRQNDAITAELRKRLREEGKVAEKEVVVEQLKPMDWSEEQRDDLKMYDGSEVLQFSRKVGPYQAGQRVSGQGYLAKGKAVPAAHFAVYERSSIGLSAGDRVRATANGRDITGKHRIDNGAFFTFRGETKDGNLALETEGGNRRVVKKDFGHLAHGLVNTSFKAQGQTKVHAIGALTQQNIGGINAEQYYVTLSRPKKSVTVITDLEDADIRRFVQRADKRKSATELMAKPVANQKPKLRDKARAFVQRMRDRYRILRDRALDGITGAARELERGDYGLAR